MGKKLSGKRRDRDYRGKTRRILYKERIHLNNTGTN